MSYLTITLDAGIHSDLNWEEAAELARASDQKLFWHFDLGAFNEDDPLSEKAHRLAFEHFLDTLYDEFRSSTLGISLFRGTLNELRGLDYLDNVTDIIPEEIDIYLLIDCQGCHDPVELAGHLDAQLFHRFKRALANSPVHFGDALWKECIEWVEPAEIGVLFPDQRSAETDALIGTFLAAEVPFRLIAEQQLLVDWEGMKCLVVHPSCLTRQLKRKLLGFAAAEGVVFVEGEEGVGIPNERLFTHPNEILTYSV